MIRKMTNQVTPKNKSYAPFLVGAFMTLAITGLIYLSSNLKTVAARSVALAVAGALILPAINAFQVQLEDEQDQPRSVLDNYSSKILDEYMLELLKLPLSSQRVGKPISNGKTKPENIAKEQDKDESQEHDVIDVVFEDGVNWEALDESISKLKAEDKSSSRASIKSLEQKDKTLVVKIFTPRDSDKAELEESFRQEYELALKEIEAAYRQELKTKDEQIALYRQQSSNLKEIVTLMAESQKKHIRAEGNVNLDVAQGSVIKIRTD
jgi:hypothetical protein